MNGRNPERAPAKIAKSVATKYWRFTKAIDKNISEEMRATPAERPSILSNRLNALVIASIQIIVKRPAKKFRCGKIENLIPVITTVVITITCHISFLPGPKFFRSSTSPIINMATPPAKKYKSLGSTETIPGRCTPFSVRKIRNEANISGRIKARTIASPPRRGMVCLWIFLSPGSSTIFKKNASEIMRGVSSNEIRNAVTNKTI